MSICLKIAFCLNYTLEICKILVKAVNPFLYATGRRAQRQHAFCVRSEPLGFKNARFDYGGDAYESSPKRFKRAAAVTGKRASVDEPPLDPTDGELRQKRDFKNGMGRSHTG